jgi:flagellar biosynthesis protein FlhG
VLANKSSLSLKPRSLTEPPDESPVKTVWAVAGGKGGTGKSFVASSLALLLASETDRVIAIDADLGGPNLHTFLGLKDISRDLGDFITKKSQRLEDAVAATPYPGLGIIKGADNILFNPNLSHFKKSRMIRQIRSLDARQIVIDLGSGTSFSTIDFFVLATAGIVVMTPEPTSIENTYYFMKSCAIRLLKIIIDAFEYADFSDALAVQLEGKEPSINQLFETFMAIRPADAHHLYGIYRNYQVHLIVNRARNEEDAALGPSVADVIHKFLHIDIDFLGTLPYDDQFDSCLRRFKPLVIERPTSPLTEALRAIARKMKGLA